MVKTGSTFFSHDNVHPVFPVAADKIYSTVRRILTITHNKLFPFISIQYISDFCTNVGRVSSFSFTFLAIQCEIWKKENVSVSNQKYMDWLASWPYYSISTSRRSTVAHGMDNISRHNRLDCKLTDSGKSETSMTFDWQHLLIFWMADDW